MTHANDCKSITSERCQGSAQQVQAQRFLAMGKLHSTEIQHALHQWFGRVPASGRVGLMTAHRTLHMYSAAYGTTTIQALSVHTSCWQPHYKGIGGGGAPSVALFLDKVTTPKPRPTRVTHPATSHQKSLVFSLPALWLPDGSSAPLKPAPAPPCSHPTSPLATITCQHLGSDHTEAPCRECSTLRQINGHQAAPNKVCATGRILS